MRISAFDASPLSSLEQARLLALEGTAKSRDSIETAEGKCAKARLLLQKSENTSSRVKSIFYVYQAYLLIGSGGTGSETVENVDRESEAFFNMVRIQHEILTNADYKLKLVIKFGGLQKPNVFFFECCAKHLWDRGIAHDVVEKVTGYHAESKKPGDFTRAELDNIFRLSEEELARAYS